jgi:hypothetical protein
MKFFCLMRLATSVALGPDERNLWSGVWGAIEPQCVEQVGCSDGCPWNNVHEGHEDIFTPPSLHRTASAE